MKQSIHLKETKQGLIAHSALAVPLRPTLLPELLERANQLSLAYGAWETVRQGRAAGTKTGFEGYFLGLSAQEKEHLLGELAQYVLSSVALAQGSEVSRVQKQSWQAAVMARRATLERLTQHLQAGALTPTELALVSRLFPVLLGRLRGAHYSQEPGVRREQEQFRQETRHLVEEGRYPHFRIDTTQGRPTAIIQEWRTEPHQSVAMVESASAAPALLADQATQILLSFLKEIGRVGDPLVRAAQELRPQIR